MHFSLSVVLASGKVAKQRSVAKAQKAWRYAKCPHTFKHFQAIGSRERLLETPENRLKRKTERASLRLDSLGTGILLHRLRHLDAFFTEIRSKKHSLGDQGEGRSSGQSEELSNPATLRRIRTASPMSMIPFPGRRNRSGSPGGATSPAVSVKVFGIRDSPSAT
jgi:hypothetical protein